MGGKATSTLVKNSSAYLKTGNPYANELFAKWNKSVMTAQALSNEEIDVVIYYADNYASAKGPAAPVPGAQAAPTESWPWLVVIALLLVVGLSAASRRA